MPGATSAARTLPTCSPAEAKALPQVDTPQGQEHTHPQARHRNSEFHEDLTKAFLNVPHWHDTVMLPGHSKQPHTPSQVHGHQGPLSPHQEWLRDQGLPEATVRFLILFVARRTLGMEEHRVTGFPRLPSGMLLSLDAGVSSTPSPLL